MPHPHLSTLPLRYDPIDPAAGDCPGRCNAGWRAAEKRRTDQHIDHDLQSRLGEPVWCPACAHTIRCALADMPTLAVRLHMEIESAHANLMEERVSGSKERAIHEHQAATFLIEDITGFLADWEDTLRKDLNLPNQRVTGVKQLQTVDNATRFLGRHLTWLLSKHPVREASEGFGLDLLALHRRAQILTKTHDVEPERCLGVACPYCDHKTLEHEIDRTTEVPTGYIKCRKCRPPLRMNPEEYQRWTKLLAADAHARGLTTHEKLVEIFGNTIPTQYTRPAVVVQ